MFIDAPGYGYASKDKKTINSWRILLENYLKESKHTSKVLALVDSKVGLTESDLSLLMFMQGLKKKITIVLTKCDKSEANELIKVTEKIQKVVGSAPLIDNYAFVTSGFLNSSHRVRDSRAQELFAELSNLKEGGPHWEVSIVLTAAIS